MSQFIDPSSLSASPSPAPSDPSSSNPRKRTRTDIPSEDRKEARAHRNRIAAQNSRDRRKAQFSYLERRVLELEEENRALRAGMALPPPVSAQIPPPLPIKAEEERQRQQENEELKERIKSLEKGWDVVMKALTAQGLSMAANPTPSSSTLPPTSTSTSAPTFPISPASSHASLDYDPSPTPQHAPLTPSPQPNTPSDHESEQKHESTRHLARVATIGQSQPMSLQRVASTLTSISTSHSFSLPPLKAIAPLPPAAMLNRHRQSTKLLWKISSERSSPRSHLLLPLLPLPALNPVITCFCHSKGRDAGRKG
jgi:hypothetical protein